MLKNSVLVQAFALLQIATAAQFIDATAANNIVLTSVNPFHGSGCSFVDFDDDGWDDLTYAAKNAAPEFYKNMGGNYTQINPAFNPALPLNADGKMPLWFDYDNDGDKDFLYTYALAPIRLYRNDGGMNFNEVTAAAGILTEAPRHMGAAAGDYDHDGWLDFFVCKYHNHILEDGVFYQNILYHNNGNGTFTDVSNSSGINSLCSGCYDVQASFMPLFLDYDRDGWQDIYVINDKMPYPNYLFHNNGDGTFQNVTMTSGAGVYMDAMSITADDYDGDDDIDIFVTNTYNENVLLNNQGDGTFEDVAENAGVYSEDGSIVAWGALWLDYDNNSLLDLYVGTLGTGLQLGNQALFYINNGDGTFSDGIQQTNIDGTEDAAYTSAMGDMNNDGYYDFINNNASPTYSKLWMNDGGTNNYFCATVEGTVSNKDGIGTWIEIWSGGSKYIRYTHAGENYMCQNSEKEIFGLGENTAVDSLHLIWPSGIEEWYFHPAINVCNHYIEAQSFSNVQVPIQAASSFICPGDSTVLDAGPAISYLWNTGDTTQTIFAPQQGIYYASLINQYGFPQYTDTVVVMTYELPQAIEDSSWVSCYGFSDGTASVGLSSGSIQSILWSNDSTTVNVSGLAPGTYSYALLDNNGCAHTGLVAVGEPQPLDYYIETTDVLCNGDASGTAEIIGLGGTPPYVYDWQGMNNEALEAGLYEVWVEDSNTCLLMVSYVINQPEALSGSVDTTNQFEDGDFGSATLTVEGGTAPYSISWSTNETGVLVLSGLPAGLYSVEVTDSNGCEWGESFIIDFVEGMPLHNLAAVEIHPNPARSWFTIAGLAALGECDIVVTDAQGRVVEKISGNRNNSLRLNTNTWSSGQYHITILKESRLLMCKTVEIIR